MHVWLPMNPAPPVTRIFFFSDIERLSFACAQRRVGNSMPSLYDQGVIPAKNSCCRNQTHDSRRAASLSECVRMIRDFLFGDSGRKREMFHVKHRKNPTFRPSSPLTHEACPRTPRADRDPARYPPLNSNTISARSLRPRKTLREPTRRGLP